MNSYSPQAIEEGYLHQLRSNVINAHLQLSHASKHYSECVLRFMEGMNNQNHANIFKALENFPLPNFPPPDTYFPQNTNGSINVPYGNHQPQSQPQPPQHQQQHQHQHQQPQPQPQPQPHHQTIPQSQAFHLDKQSPYFNTVTPHQPLKQPGSVAIPPVPAGTPTMKRKAEDDDEMEVDGKKKKKRKAKDPNAPKRPASAYILFQNKIREQMKQEPGNESLSHKDMTKKIGERWNAMTTERQPYVDLAKQAMDVWNRDKEKYKAEHPEGPDLSNVVQPKKRGRKSNAERAELAAAKAAEDAASAAQAGQQPSVPTTIAPNATIASGATGAASGSSPISSSDSSDDSDDSDDETSGPPPAPSTAKKSSSNTAAQRNAKPTATANDSSDDSDDSSSDDDDDEVVQKQTARSKQVTAQTPAAVAPSMTQHSRTQAQAHAPTSFTVASPEKKKKKKKEKA